MNERQFGEESGFTKISTYRKKGLIKSVGTFVTNAGLSHFYHPRQIKELRKKLGITLESTKGLLVEFQFALKAKLDQGTIKRCREQGLIKSVGTSVTGGGLSHFYKPSQITELKKKLKNK